MQSNAPLMAPTANRPKGPAVIEVASVRSKDAIAVVFGAALVFIFNPMRASGRCYVRGDDIRSASLRAAVRVTPKLSDEQIGRLAEFIRLRIIRSLLRDEFVIFGDSTSEHDCWRRLGGLGEVFDEISRRDRNSTGSFRAA